MATATLSANKTKMVTGVFRDRLEAEQVHGWLIRSGYTASEVNVLVSEEVRAKYYAHPDKDKPIKARSEAAEGVALGGTVGTAVGATLAGLLAIGTSVMIPGLGIIVAGPILAALAGGGAGAVTGGVIGGLIGLGIPEGNAKAYEEVLRQGGVVLGVIPKTSSDAARIEKFFEEHHGDSVLYA